MKYYATLRENRKDDEALQNCIENVVEKLTEAETPQRPGMLLGKIQSGKTRAFLGIIARAFDKDYSIAIVLTKGTKTLAQQTVKRISADFESFIEDDEITVFDIMSAPKLPRSELRRKIVIVAKKEFRNLQRIIKFFEKDYPQLVDRKTLLVDDEADMASVRFAKKKGAADYDQGTIANEMDRLRSIIREISFLQVTATPYALYLQPEDYEKSSDGGEVFYPKRPCFTEVLPIHDAYVGGNDYFGEHAENDPRSFLFIPVSTREQEALRSKDGRSIREDRIWTTDNIKTLRQSLMTFLLSVAVRREQQARLDQRQLKYAMIMHNDTQRGAHNWQSQTVERIKSAFETAAEEGAHKGFLQLFDSAYSDINASVTADGGYMPTAELALQKVRELIIDGELNIQLVNSDVQLEPLLDPKTAELRLRTKANLFIGGSILDRGITIPHLLAFYYGRNPKRMQADTVLQHSRMYGARPRSDLAVTRFYTSPEVYQRLALVNDLENALRQAFEAGSHDKGVVFIQSDAKSGIIPCAPNKVSMSDVVAVKPNDVLSPNNFNTVGKIDLSKIVKEAEKLIPEECKGTRTFSQIPIETAIQLIELCELSLKSDPGYSFDWDAMKGLLEYYSNASNGMVQILLEQGRELDKGRSGDRSGLSILGSSELRALAQNEQRTQPALVILKQKGGAELRWNAGPFLWPILVSPPGAKACVFATKLSA